MQKRKSDEVMLTCNLTEDQLPFDLDLTLSCGQAFRWEQSSAGWTGQVNGAVVTIRQEGRSLIYNGMDEETLIRYFNLDIIARILYAKGYFSFRREFRRIAQQSCQHLAQSSAVSVDRQRSLQNL